jgi:hypothetical protein
MRKNNKTVTVGRREEELFIKQFFRGLQGVNVKGMLCVASLQPL